MIDGFQFVALLHFFIALQERFEDVIAALPVLGALAFVVDFRIEWRRYLRPVCVTQNSGIKV